MITRRRLLGSAAIVGAGAATMSLSNIATPAAQTTNARLAKEIERQLRDGLQKLHKGKKGNGARQLANTFRLQAATVDDAVVRSYLRRAIAQKGKWAVANATPNHKEMDRLAKVLGVPKELRQHHASDPAAAEAMIDRMLKEGFTPFMLQSADMLERGADRLDRIGAMMQPVASRQCAGACESECGQADAAMEAAAVACSIAILFPPAMPWCEAASGVYLMLEAYCAICRTVAWWYCD